MARRRMIDPNIWQSEDVAELSMFARLLLIGLISNADDEGRGKANPVFLKSTIFPYDEISIEEVKKALEEGIIATFMKFGFCVTNPTCGACLGMSNGVLAENEVCASTTNRNFNGRMGKGGMVHLMSPASAAATAVAGYITNSPMYKGK